MRSNQKQNQNFINNNNQSLSKNIRNTPDHKEMKNFNQLQKNNKKYSSNNLFCINHPDKPYSHMLHIKQSSQQQPFCQKCAIMLASKGFNITKLNSKPPSPITSRMERKIQIQTFLEQLNNLFKHAERLNLQSQKALKQSEQHYNGLMMQIQLYFKQIQEIIQTQKYMAYNALLNYRSDIQSQLRVLKQSLYHQLQQLNDIANDIQGNSEAVKTVDKPTYESIMSNYRQKLQVCSYYQFLQVKPLPLHQIILPQIPKNIYSISDKIILKQQNILPPSRKIQNSYKSRLSNQSILSKQLQENLKKTIKNIQKKDKVVNKNEKQGLQCNNDYSFESNGGSFIVDNSQIFNKNMFNKNKKNFHPQQMIIRQSLNLTQIKQNDQEEQLNHKIFRNINQDTIQEEIRTSRQSLTGFLVLDTFNQSQKQQSRKNQQTDTLLIS